MHISLFTALCFTVWLIPRYQLLWICKCIVSDLWIRVFRGVILRFLLGGFTRKIYFFFGFKIWFLLFLFVFVVFFRGFWRWVLNCSLNFSQIWNFGFWWCFEFDFFFSILGGLFFNYFSFFWNSFKKNSENLKFGGSFFVFLIENYDIW